MGIPFLENQSEAGFAVVVWGGVGTSGSKARQWRRRSVMTRQGWEVLDLLDHVEQVPTVTARHSDERLATIRPIGASPARR